MDRIFEKRMDGTDTVWAVVYAYAYFCTAWNYESGYGKAYTLNPVF